MGKEEDESVYFALVKGGGHRTDIAEEVSQVEDESGSGGEREERVGK